MKTKRIQKNKRVESKVTILFLLILVGVLLSGTYLVSAMSSTPSKLKRQKYYKSITVESGDTLWDIAGEYISEEYASKNDYIKEVRTINQLNSNKINAGAKLCLPYYAEAVDIS